MKLGSVFCALILVPLLAAGDATQEVLVPPSQDPFYSPPLGYKRADAGAILRSRAIHYNGTVDNVESVHQLLYRTVDVLGNKIATVATILQPHNANASRVVSFQEYEDAPWIDCAPSYADIHLNSNAMTNIYLSALMNKGYYVVLPDFQGPNSAYLCGGTSGLGVLDGIRATLASGHLTGIHASAQVQLWGYSGGAHASGWAVQMKKSYANELNIIGAALGGTPVDVNATFIAIDGTSSAGIIPSALLGLSQQYKHLHRYIFSSLLPKNKPVWTKAGQQCLGPFLTQFANQNISMYFKRPDYLDHPVVAKVLKENYMGKQVPTGIPLHMYHAVPDEVVPYPPVIDMVQTWCSKGANLEFVSDKISHHLALAYTGSAQALNFIVDRFEGVAFASGCANKTTSYHGIEPFAQAAFGQTLYNELLALYNKTFSTHE
ncbi:secretory lipase-domain-containing protein [Gongronella butleri]|nr:secretory lipase-domain-containing protein [Gongronella butleri]